jgi:hypothetical protein
MTTFVNIITGPAPAATTTAAGALVGPVTAARANGATTVDVVEPYGATYLATSSYCSTMTMRGDGLPTVVAGPCGPMLIANAASGVVPPAALGSAVLAGVWLLWIVGRW